MIQFDDIILFKRGWNHQLVFWLTVSQLFSDLFDVKPLSIALKCFNENCLKLCLDFWIWLSVQHENHLQLKWSSVHKTPQSPKHLKVSYIPVVYDWTFPWNPWRIFKNLLFLVSMQNFGSRLPPEALCYAPSKLPTQVFRTALPVCNNGTLAMQWKYLNRWSRHPLAIEKSDRRRNKKIKGRNKQISRETSIYISNNQTLLGQWLNYKLFGITYLVGKIKYKLYFRVPLAKWETIR